MTQLTVALRLRCKNISKKAYKLNAQYTVRTNLGGNSAMAKLSYERGAVISVAVNLQCRRDIGDVGKLILANPFIDKQAAG